MPDCSGTFLMSSGAKRWRMSLAMQGPCLTLGDSRIAASADQPRQVGLARRDDLVLREPFLDDIPDGLARRTLRYGRPARDLVALVRVERNAREAHVGDAAAHLRARLARIGEPADAHH